jgi:putative flippase GtrA
MAAGEQRPRLKRWSESIAARPLVGPLWRRLQANPKELERFGKFALVGIFGAVVDFTVLNLMKRAFETIGLGYGWNTSLDPRQIQLALANTVSFSLAVLSNFTWNRLWTFPESRERPLAPQLLQFSVVNVVGWGINTALLLAMDYFVFQHFMSDRMSYNFAKAFAIGVVLFWNYGVNRIWTYRGIK